MNELFFFAHILLLLGFIYMAGRLGKYALIAVSAIQVVLANLFITKEITLFSFSVTPTDAYTIGSLVALSLLQEIYGKEEAKKVAKINFFILLFFVGMALIQILYQPALHDRFHQAFAFILTPSPRIFFSSLLCFYLTQKLDIRLFGWLRKKFSLNQAMALSLAATQAFDTVAFSCLALKGFVHSVTHIILVSYLIKMIAALTMVPFAKRISTHWSLCNSK